MRTFAFGFVAAFLCSTSFAEPVSLICEYDGGVNVETGLRDGSYGDVFSFSFEPVLERLVAGFQHADEKTFILTGDLIDMKIVYGETSDSDTYWYKINRHTGTLFVRRIVGYQGKNNTWKAQGRCVTNKRLF